MKRARIEYELLEGERFAVYESIFDWQSVVKAHTTEEAAAVLLIEVEDADDADALVALIERHDKTSAQPKKPRKPRTVKQPATAVAPAAPSVAKAAAAGKEEVKPDDPPCTAHADGVHRRTGGAACLCEPAKADPLPPVPEGKVRAHRVAKQVEGDATKASA